MIVRARLPERVVIGADTRLLVLTLNSQSAFESYQHKDPFLHLRKYDDEWRITPFAQEKGKIYFDLANTSAMQYRGLYKAELKAEDCVIDELEIIKGASYRVTAEAKDDSCIDGVWDEFCPVEPPKRCVTTGEYVCGCDCENQPAPRCAACLKEVVYATIKPLPGY